MGIKASYRNGRSGKHGNYNVSHNFRDETRAKETHIDTERTKKNIYVVFDERGHATRIDGKYDVRQHELDQYEHYYRDGQQAQNDRHIKARHKDRCRTTEDLYKSTKTAPLESIFQFSKKDDNLDRATQSKITYLATADTVNDLMRDYGKNFKMLDFAVHMDETTVHVHSRATLGSVDKNGHFMPNQTQALKEMGFDNSNHTRYNNPLIDFTDHVREVFYSHCEERAKELGLDITIDRQVVGDSHRYEEAQKHRIQENKDLLQQAVDLAEGLIQGVNDDILKQQALDFVNKAKTRNEHGEVVHLKDVFYDKWLPNHEQIKDTQEYKDFQNVCETVQNGSQDFIDHSDEEIGIERP